MQPRDQEILFSKAKEYLLYKTSTLTPDNAIECLNEIRLSLSFIESLLSLPFLKVPSQVENIHPKESDYSEPEIFDGNHLTGVLYRKARGGYLIGTQVQVPEGIIRSLGLEHGDFVKANIKSEHPRRYFFEVLEKGDCLPNPERIVYTYCVVEKDKQGFFVENRWNGSEIASLPNSYPISNWDVNEFELSDGDLIDIASLSTHTDFHVIWKWDINTEHHKEVQKPKKREKTMSAQEEGTILTIFEGKTIFVVGNHKMKHLFKDSIEKLGGEFLWMEGSPTDDTHRLESMVTKSDIVVYVQRASSHAGFFELRHFCKKHGKPLGITTKLSVHGVIQAALNPNSPYNASGSLE